MDYGEIREISSEKARELLTKKGMNISLEETEEILKFLRKLARIAVEQHLRMAPVKDFKADKDETDSIF